MSWDLEIVVHDRPDRSALLAALPERAALEGSFDPDVGPAVVNRRVRGEQIPAFTIDGPFAVEPEDVAHFGAAVVSPRWLVVLSVRIDQPGAVRRSARRLARHLASDFRGAVFDPQLDAVVWPRGARRPAAHAQADAPNGEVRLEWCAKPEALTASARGLLGSVRRHLPEAMPTRFGPYEPLQHRFGDDDGFVEVWTSEAARDGALFWHATRPCLGGSAAWPVDNEAHARRGGVAAGQIQMSFHLQMVSGPDSRWRDAVIYLFESVAVATDSFYARAVVNAGVRTAGSGDSESGRAPASVWRGRWHGIPVRECWLVWLGRRYAAAAGLPLDARGVGHLRRAADDPAGHLSVPAFPRDLERRLDGPGRMIETLGPRLEIRDADRLVVG